ncbi:hypothetical protein AAFF_G00100480 [Aldrovandia affinis]|uniref:Small acidic protein-like domain-containing protein n=1 Tax=Aldrovandia affinis TaxID=143900 RepID=A0AAD7RUS5_9TELE|nr:hypothetical protein AAFF_G00100480 [Aldrovandia affinis]
MEEGGDSEEKQTKEGKKEKTKGEKRRAPAEVRGEGAVESLNSQEGEGELKKKKKQEKADVVGSGEEPGVEEVTTPKRRKVKEIAEAGNGEKTKKKKKGKQEEEGKKNKKSANGGIGPEEKHGGEENTSPKKGGKKKVQGQDAEAVKKLRKRKKQGEEGEQAEERKIYPVKSEPELTTSPSVDVVFVSEKIGNKDEVRIDQARRQALQVEIDNESHPKVSNSSTDLGQWGTAHFESTNQQQKFLRLMGGLKKGSQPVGSSEGRANMALGKEGQDVLKQGLLGEFERAQSRRMDFQNRGVGLGFTPPSDKKFSIDANACQSVRFDD